MRTLPLLLAGVAAFAPARSSLRSRRPSAPGAVKLEGDAKKAMTEVREKIGVREDGDFYDLDAAPWEAIRDDFPALASLSDEELRAAIVAAGAAAKGLSQLAVVAAWYAFSRD